MDAQYHPAVRASCAALLILALGCEDAPPAAKTAPQPSSNPAPHADNAQAPAPRATLKRWSFDDTRSGALPEGFEVLETASSDTPATWGVVEDPTAPSGGKGFGVLKTANRGQTYNVALAPTLTASDVELTVWVKANTGEQDQGGGVVWRANGARDYYIARWNPLEQNVRFYIVVNEQRSAFAAADIDLDTSEWHAMRIIAEGDRMELFMDDASVLVAKDETLTGPGRVGLWTKADAATWFDDLTAAEL